MGAQIDQTGQENSSGDEELIATGTSQSAFWSRTLQPTFYIPDHYASDLLRGNLAEIQWGQNA